MTQGGATGVKKKTFRINEIRSLWVGFVFTERDKHRQYMYSTKKTGNKKSGKIKKGVTQSDKDRDIS